MGLQRARRHAGKLARIILGFYHTEFRTYEWAKNVCKMLAQVERNFQRQAVRAEEKASSCRIASRKSLS